MTTSSIGVTGQQGAQNPTGYDAYQEMDLGDFVDLMVAELQNQDPLNPMDNAQILQQMSQIREIGSNDKLVETLDAMLMGQNVATASSMIGQWIMKLADDNQVQMAGRVDSVSIEDGKPKLTVGNRSIPLDSTSPVQVISDAMGQEIGDAVSKIGQTLRGTSDATPQIIPQEITGRIEKVSYVNNEIKYHVGDFTVSADNVDEIVAPITADDSTADDNSEESDA